MAEFQPPEGLRLLAYRAAREWAAEHRHQQPDDRMVDAALTALFDACKVREAYSRRGRYLALMFPLPDDALAKDLKRIRSGRPSKYDIGHYTEVAHVYQSAFIRGQSPTRAVAEHFVVSRAQAGKWVSTARNKYGLLAGTRKGHANGAIRTGATA